MTDGGPGEREGERERERYERVREHTCQGKWMRVCPSICLLAVILFSRQEFWSTEWHDCLTVSLISYSLSFSKALPSSQGQCYLIHGQVAFSRLVNFSVLHCCSLSLSHSHFRFRFRLNSDGVVVPLFCILEKQIANLLLADSAWAKLHPSWIFGRYDLEHVWLFTMT